MKPIHPAISLRALAACVLLLSPAAAQSTERVSVDGAGLQGNGESENAVISADGRFVAFDSSASNLVPGDVNGLPDVFIHDRQTGQVSLVSAAPGGAGGNGFSLDPAISRDGRYVAFRSKSDNLAPGDLNGTWDVFVHDRLTGQTAMVSLSSSGTPGNGLSLEPAISGDGRLVAFSSQADNLVPGDTNGAYDVFVHDLQTGVTARVSVSSAGAQGSGSSFRPCLSADGFSVAFQSNAPDLVPGDTNASYDVFVRQLGSGQTQRVSVDSSGVEGNGASEDPALSADGLVVAFHSIADNLDPDDGNIAIDVFAHDLATGQTSRISVDAAGQNANFIKANTNPSLSADGRFAAFYSRSDSLVAGDTNGDHDVFVRDRLRGETSRVSVDNLGAQGNGHSQDPSLSADGRLVAFWSLADNLAAGDTNGVADCFVHDRGPEGPSLAMAGTCPGAITLTIRYATAGGWVAIVHGPPGIYYKLTPPCLGLRLQIAPPSLGGILSADAAGVALSSLQIPANACGRSVQAVDVATCTASNVIVL